jgi:hypothetical protein
MSAVFQIDTVALTPSAEVTAAICAPSREIETSLMAGFLAKSNAEGRAAFSARAMWGTSAPTTATKQKQIRIILEYKIIAFRGSDKV